MSGGLALAHGSLLKATRELEDAIEEAPAYSVEALRFLKVELAEIVRRVENARRVLEATLDP